MHTHHNMIQYITIQLKSVWFHNFKMIYKSTTEHTNKYIVHLDPQRNSVFSTMSAVTHFKEPEKLKV